MATTLNTITALAFNTSWVTDAHVSQLEGNNFMSESSSILAKALELYNNNNNNKATIEALRTAISSDVDKVVQAIENDGAKRSFNEPVPELVKQANTIVKEMEAMPEIGDEMFKTLRKSMATASTNYIKNFMFVKQPSFVALTEQTIHVPNDHLANYDVVCPRGMKTVMDLSKHHAVNEDFGILARIQALGVDDIDYNPTIDSTRPYAIVYDNIVNHAPYARNGEGIAIVFRKDLFDVTFQWDVGAQPLRKEMGDTRAGTLSYYSADSGPSVCYGKDAQGNQIVLYAKDDKGTVDGGRPVIMAGGYNTKTNTVYVMAAFHGPNVPLLFPYDHVAGRRTQFSTEQGDKPLQIGALMDVPEYADKVKAIYQQIQQGLLSFIRDGLSNMKAEVKAGLTGINDTTTWIVEIGGDFNDPRGMILEAFLANPIVFPKESFPGMTKDIEVSFNYPTLTPTNAPKSSGDTQMRYPALVSCCANADSVKATQDQKSRKPGKQRGMYMNGTHLLYLLAQYPEDFYKPENFGYNGDFIMCGSNKTGDMRSMMYLGNKTYTDSNMHDPVFIDDKENINRLQISAGIYGSDHLPVVSISRVRATGGKKSRRKKCRSRIRNTKRRYRKNTRSLGQRKLRAS